MMPEIYDYAMAIITVASILGGGMVLANIMYWLVNKIRRK